MPFETLNGRERFSNDCVNIWLCPRCGSWRQIGEERCAIDGTPRDVQTEPQPKMLGQSAAD